MGSTSSKNEFSTQYQSFRKEGNEFCKKTEDVLLPLADQSGCLVKAMMCYRQALNISVSSIEKTTALKDIAMTSMKLFTLLFHVEKRTSSAENYLKEGIQSFDMAFILGQSDGKVHLCKSINILYMENIDLLFRHLATKETIKDRSQILDDIVKKIDHTQAKSRILRETARTYFRGSVKALEEGDFKCCLSLLRDCHHPLEEAKQYTKKKRSSNIKHIMLYFLHHIPNGTDEEDTTELETSVFLQQCRAESLQARNTGDALLRKSLNDTENLDMEAVYTVIDLYKKAILLTKEIEVEMEAIALSRLGNLYETILKDKTRAKQNFLRSLQLAGSLQPRMFHQEDWYKLAADALERYQKEYAAREDEERSKEREPYLKELKWELKKLEEQKKEGTIPMLEYIYKTWPPKGENKKLLELTNDNEVIKKALKRAIFHYHPDKQDANRDGMKWCVFTEEITKALTSTYEGLK